MKNTGQIRISQCMIVKNEEKNIERALSWGRDMMWEQIVVDTGSTDRTEEIAEKMGARLCHFPWIDDFAAAKNYAIQQAKGDWIIFLDADEYFSREDARKLLDILKNLETSEYNAVAASWVQIDDGEDILREKTGERLKWQMTVKTDGSRGVSLSGTQIRVFRNQPGLRYQGRIHEKLFMENGEIFCLDASKELSILHTGYTPSEMKEKQKVERNISLIKKELEAHPADYKMLIYLGDSYYQQGNKKEALKWYEQAASYLPEELGEDNIQGAMLFKHLLLLYMDIFDENQSQKVYLNGTGRFPKDADFDYLLGRHQAELGHYEDGTRHLERALGLLDKYGSDGISVLLSRSLIQAWETLVECYYENDNLEACVNSAVTLLRADPRRPETLKTMLKAFKKDEARSEKTAKTAASASQVLSFLGNFYDCSKQEDREFLLRAGKEAGYEGFVEAVGDLTLLSEL